MKKLLSMLLIITACTTIYAQDSNKELIDKLVEKNILSRNEADSLLSSSTESSKSTSFTHTVEKVREAFNTPYMQFGGYGLMMYKYSDVNDVKHTLDARVIFLTMQGQLFNNFRYFAMMEFVKPTLTEFYIDWTPSSKFNLRVGQAKTPFSQENQFSLTALESIVNTRSVSALAGMGDDVLKKQNDRNNIGRDLGIKASGSLINMHTHDFLEYGIGLYQGTGLITSETNNSKDFIANIMLQPLKGFRIGGGGYFGEATYIKDGETEKADHVRNRWIVSSDYKSSCFYARAEWIKGNDGGIKKEGIHGVGLWYFIPEKLNAFAKVDYLNMDKAINSEVMDYTFGVNYYFYKSCRFQLNYTYSDYSNKWDAPNSNVVLGQMQIVF
ncbi:porin [Prevotella sp. 10(H)]|uniref:porin n=1 Tax=Prevotella sp. 10(H) TaxID=1158294 RepID=UPI0004A73862|nr:porin [Prevotella sp. 10(H)]